MEANSGLPLPPIRVVQSMRVSSRALEKKRRDDRKGSLLLRFRCMAMGANRIMLRGNPNMMAVTMNILFADDDADVLMLYKQVLELDL